MTPDAPDWQPLTPTTLSPYAHWFRDREARFYPGIDLPDETVEAGNEAGPGKISPTAQAMLQEKFLGGGIVPLPGGSRNAAFDLSQTWAPDAEALGRMGTPPRDAVITGVIDTGIAVANSRFRAPDGSSRVLASWQQSGRFGGQDFLPFGQELYRADIDALIATHSSGGKLDEERFNRAAGISDFGRLYGQRDVEFRAAHGAHVADLAAGFDRRMPISGLDRRPVIAVNFPDRIAHGSAGNYLEFFSIFAVERIVALSDALWAHLYGTDEGPLGGRGFPVVINLSYGMQAGPKDGQMAFERAVADLTEDRAAAGLSPLRLILPTGNENLNQCHAFADLGDRDFTDGLDPVEIERQKECRPQVDLPWRVLPGDPSSNFVEIWTDTTRKPAEKIEICVAAPGQRDAPWVGAKPGHFVDLSDTLRLYCSAETRGGGRKRYGFVVAIMPTEILPVDTDGEKPVPARAGLWTISLRCGGRAMGINAHVQSDQSVTPGARVTLASYFDAPEYRPVISASGESLRLPTGGDRDSYAIPLGGTAYAAMEGAGDGPVSRRGTHNAIGSTEAVALIGGYRLSDQRAAPYSATTTDRRGAATGRSEMSGLCPSDDGAAHPGLLAAGGRSGTLAALQGTSMATALATRMAVDALLAGDVEAGTDGWFRARAVSVGAGGASKEGSGLLASQEAERRTRHRFGV